jgi:hypothetical protein
MRAARTQTLLKITYKGEDRIVEPYSLKYQQRRDGIEREYFFAWKLSGGASAPGIRMFTADNMQAIENTNVEFKPRYQTELSKAGEMPENRYLFDPNKPDRTLRLRRFSNGPKYIYQCSHCGKRFTRSSRNSNLHSHKSPGGSTCYGSYGVYIGTK